MLYCTNHTYTNRTVTGRRLIRVLCALSVEKYHQSICRLLDFLSSSLSFSELNHTFLSVCFVFFPTHFHVVTVVIVIILQAQLSDHSRSSAFPGKEMFHISSYLNQRQTASAKNSLLALLRTDFIYVYTHTIYLELFEFCSSSFF